MRVLLVPEVYRPDDATASGTVVDAALWVERWLERDDGIHVYWLMPPRSDADYEAADVVADRERVTLIEAEPPVTIAHPPAGGDLYGTVLQPNGRRNHVLDTFGF